MNTIFKTLFSRLWPVALALLVAGCAASKPAKPEAVPAQLGAAPARVVSVKSEYRFVVIDFQAQTVPSAGAEVAIYRDGQKVATVRVTEPARGRFVTADVLDGEPQIDDEAR